MMMEQGYVDIKRWLTPKYVVVYLLVGVLVYGLVYYFLTGRSSSNYSQQQKMVPEWRVNLASGSAVLTEVDGKTKVVVVLDNDPGSVWRPTHIHLGTCPNPGAIKYPLQSVVNGRSETVLETTIDSLKAMLPLSINVHKSAVEPDEYISCGDLR